MHVVSGWLADVMPYQSLVSQALNTNSGALRNGPE